MKALIGWPAGHPVIALLLLLVLLLSAAVLTPRLPLERLPATPGVGLRVQAELPGIDAAQIERLVTQPLEQTFATLPGLQEMISRASDGRVAIGLQFDSVAARERAVDEAIRRIAHATAMLPVGMAVPTVERDDPALRAAAIYAVTAEPLSAPLSAQVATWAERELRRPLHELPETVAATLEGAASTEILIQPDSRRLATLGLSFDDLIQVLRNDEAPRQRSTRRIATGLPASAEAIAARAVRLPGGDSVALAEVANVTVTERPSLERPRHQGAAALLLHVYPRSAIETADVAARTHAHLAWLRANGLVPANVTVHKVFDESDETRKWLRRVLKRVAVSLAVSLTVVGLFLGARAGLLTLAAFLVWLPLCAASAWAVGMSFTVTSAAGAMFAYASLLLLTLRFAATPAVVALALVALLASWFGREALGVYVQTLTSFSLATLLAVPVAWLMSAWSSNALLRKKGLARWLPPLVSLSIVLVTVLLAVTAAVRTLPAAVAEMTGGTLVLRVQGQDEAQVTALVDELLPQVRALPALTRVAHSSAPVETWRLQLDDARMQQAGIGIVDVGRAFEIARKGLVVGELADVDAHLLLRVQLAPAAAGTAFERLLLRGERSDDRRALYLRDIGLAERVIGPRERLRVQQAPAAEISARWIGPQVPPELSQLRQTLSAPPGFLLQWDIVTTSEVN